MLQPLVVMSGNPPFTEDQKQYLEGFLAGIASKRGIAAPNSAAAASGGAPANAAPPSSDPADIHRAAQDRAVAAGTPRND